jgi:hypothetical protein
VEILKDKELEDYNIPLPERILINILDYIGGRVKIEAMKEILEVLKISPDIAIGQALEKKWIRIEEGMIYKI